MTDTEIAKLFTRLSGLFIPGCAGKWSPDEAEFQRDGNAHLFKPLDAKVVNLVLTERIARNEIPSVYGLFVAARDRQFPGGAAKARRQDADDAPMRQMSAAEWHEWFRGKCAAHGVRFDVGHPADAEPFDESGRRVAQKGKEE